MKEAYTKKRIKNDIALKIAELKGDLEFFSNEDQKHLRFNKIGKIAALEAVLDALEQRINLIDLL